jgi:hypothetical protein
MTSNHLAAISKHRLFLSTEEFAEQLTIRPQSIRKRYCQTGGYFGVRPVKMPNGRLMWPADAIQKLTEAA